MIRVLLIVVTVFLSLPFGCSAQVQRTVEHVDNGSAATRGTQTIRQRIPPPRGFERVPTEPGSFAEWLITLPLKPEGSPVMLWDGRKKPNQNAHHAVIALDVGDRDLQQCADAIIRLRAEYLWAVKHYSDIHFNFTSGDRADYEKWSEGYRPRVSNNDVTWVKSAAPDKSYDGFRKYLDTLFQYAGTASLSAELVSVPQVERMAIGDVFIRGGFPGHAVIVVDMVQSRDEKKRLFLLAQSYMPAQDIHVLSNPTDSNLSPWYELEFGDELVTPEYTFLRSELKRF